MMGQGDRQNLDIPKLDDLDDFDVRPKPTPHKATAPSNDRERKAIDATASFPSREASTEGQLNIKGPRDVLDRFRRLRKTERYPYAELLEMMMDAYESQKG